jgi:hypothetical protein
LEKNTVSVFRADVGKWIVYTGLEEGLGRGEIGQPFKE